MRIETYRDDQTLVALTTLLRGLTSSRTAQEAFTSFMRHYWKVRPVDCLLGVVQDSSGSGRFRIIYHVARGHVENDHPLPARNPGPAWNEEAVIHEGGVIAALIEGDEPRMAFELDLSRDPVLKDLAPNCVTAMSLPVFAGELVTEWVIGLSRVRDGFAVENVRSGLLTANFMAMANSHLLFVEEYRDLNKQLTAQFEDVARVQQALLPKRTPVVPGLDIATSYLTSDVAGGDYYDVQALPDGRYGFVIADASGHGAGAATVMAMFRAILHCTPPSIKSPAEMLRFVDDRLSAAELEGMFVTAFLGIYDPITGEVRYSNAGHPPPRIKRGRDGSVHELDGAASFPLGVEASVGREDGLVTLGARDTMVLYTDGISEAFDPSRTTMFGVEGLDTALEKCSGMPDCVVESVHRALFEFTRARTRDDDQTLVALRRKDLGS